MKTLDLSDSQRTQVRAVFKDNVPTLQPLVKQLVSERRTLRGIIQTVPVNEAAIRAEAAKVASIEADLDVQRAQVSQSIQKILTPDQVQKFRGLQSKFDERVDAGLDRFAKWSAQP
ncbi:MAG: Spy/CpxP family protein refolding chaperone [Chthoniobacteraceae bacterium]